MKAKVVAKIESFSSKDGTLLLSVKEYEARYVLKEMVEKCEQKYNGYARLEVSPPYRPRTTGKDSQNNLIWKLITEIAKETGNEIQDVEEAVKERACRRGYPYRVNKITGRAKPKSMTEIDTVEAGYLIEELYQICAEYGIDVIPEEKQVSELPQTTLPEESSEPVDNAIQEADEIEELYQKCKESDYDIF